MAAVVVAKGKKKLQDAEKQKELEESVGEVKVIQNKGKSEKQQVPSKEIINILTDSFDRLYLEIAPVTMQDEKLRRANADDQARQTLRLIRYGIPYEGQTGTGLRITDEEQKIPLCKDCK